MTILFLTISAFSRFPTYKRATGVGAGLATLGHEVYIAVEDCDENRNRFPVEAPGCHPLWVRKSNPLMEAWQKMRLLWNLRPDVLYTTSYSIRNLQWMSFLFPRRTKYVFEVCELYSSYQALWKIKERLMMIEADGMVCASRYLEDSFKRRLCGMGLKRPILYLPYAYPPYLKSLKTTTANAVVHMAYMSRGYGCFAVMEAFERIREAHPGIVLEMLGAGPDFEEMKQWVAARQLGNVIHLRGFVAEDELNDYFSRAQAFTVPMRNAETEWARCPSKLFYYLPYNKPIITCKVGNPYDILGELGYYYEPENVEDMARAMDRALRDAANFAYPKGFVESHGWLSRAVAFDKWAEVNLR